MPSYIFYDLNARDPFVSDSTDMMLVDTKTVIQSVWRLLTTEEGEIPNFRSYGLSIKKFVQYPLNQNTIEVIYNYVKDRIQAFEERAEIIKAEVDASFDKGEIYMSFILRVKSTGDMIKMPTWTVKIGRS